MQRGERSKAFRQRNLLQRQDVDALFPEPPAPSTDLGQIVALPINELWFDDQPRQIVPDSVFTELANGGRVRPTAVLAALDDVAAQRPYYRRVLDALRDLSTTIQSDGVLEPLLVAESCHEYVVRDGHRRTLASLLADKEAVPAHVIQETSSVETTARQFVVNIQREDLTALEKGRWLLRLARLIESQIRAELAIDDAVPSVVNALVDRGSSDGTDGDGASGASLIERDLAAKVRTRVCKLTGLSQRHYYNFMYLNRLTPDAREAGVGLSEGQLRPVTTLPPNDQLPIVEFIAQRQLTSKEAHSLVQVAKSGDHDAVRRVMAKLAKADVGRQRTSVSWDVLLHAIPKDVSARCSSLRTELQVLPDNLRDTRLRTLWEQRALARELTQQYDEIFQLYGYAGPSASDPTTDPNSGD